MKHPNRRSLAAAAIMIVLGALASCATVQVNPIPAPPPTAKLRVYVQPLTGEGKWGTPHEVYEQNQLRRVERFLERTGIYDVVGEQEVRAVLGDQRVERSQLERNGWALARRIGEALHVDYVMVMERVKPRGAAGGRDFLFVNVMINVGSGKVFESRTQLEGITRGDQEEQRELMRRTYRNIFQSCKQDMLATAVRKGRAYLPPAEAVPGKSVVQTIEPQKPEAPPTAKGPEPPSVIPPASIQKPEVPPLSAPVKPALTAEPKEGAPPAEVKQQTPPPAPKQDETPVVAKTIPPSPNLTGPGLIEAPKKDGGTKKIVVYDFDAADRYRTVALILAEALREEVFKLKQFVLVNREDLQKVLEEMALQQTGLIDEKEAVRTGKGLAASQVVTGRLGLLGKTFVMQAKRVDIETFGTMGLASIKFTEGQEDEVLNKMPEFTRGLVGLQ